MDAVREDPRVTRSRTRIVDAAYAALADEGAAGITMEGVAARAEVAKTTVYRLFPGRGALLLAAFERVSDVPEVADGGELRDDLIAFAVGLEEKFAHDPWARALPALVDEAERDVAIADLARQLATRRRGPLVRRLQRAADEGELPDTTDPELVAALLLGPLFYRRFFTRDRTTVAQIEAIVSTVLDGFTRPDRPVASTS